MIDNQRALFDVPEDVAYLNCAYTAPLLHSAAAAGVAAIERKRKPWSIHPADFFTELEANRERFAALIDAPADCVCLVPSASYGIAIAAANVSVAPGQEILMLEEQFPSNLYSWKRLAQERGGALVTVRRPENADWTAAILPQITTKTAVVALPNCHWTDGALIDLEKIGERCRETEAALVVDGTQSIGAMPFSVPRVQPDVVVSVTHKWLLGPYAYGFCYVASHLQNGRPLEENWLNRAGSEDFSALTKNVDAYRTGARRFDAGASSNFILAPIAGAALRQIHMWTVKEISETLGSMTARIGDRALRLGFRCAPSRLRAPHMIGIRSPRPLPADLAVRLTEQKVFVSVRGDAVRIAPHLHVTEDDIDRLFAALTRALAG